MTFAIVLSEMVSFCFIAFTAFLQSKLTNNNLLCTLKKGFFNPSPVVLCINFIFIQESVIFPIQQKDIFKNSSLLSAPKGMEKALC